MGGGEGNKKREKKEKERMTDLCLVVEMPEVQTAHDVGTGEESRVGRRPLHVAHVVAVVLKGAQVLLLLFTTQGRHR